METLQQTTIIKKLTSEGISLFTISDFKKFFGVSKDNTAYKIIERLTEKGILKKLSKKRYLFALKPVDDFQMANFLYQPSYISLESALSFYGILSQFSYQVTSVSPKKTRSFEAQGKEFAYFHIKPALFFGYEKKENFLIALPEKALIDYLYFGSKGLRVLSLEEFDLSIIKKETMAYLLSLTKNKQLENIIKTKML